MKPLTEQQRLLLRCSASSPHRNGGGCGVELRGAGWWRTARSLVARGLGDIEGGHPQGSSLPGLFFANEDGVEAVTPEIEGDDE